MAKNTQPVLPISWESTAANAKIWLNIIRYRESGTVVQIQDDSEYRVPQVIENKILLKKNLGKYYGKYLLVYVPVDDIDWKVAAKKALLKEAAKRKIDKSGKISKLDFSELVKTLDTHGYDIGIFISNVTPKLETYNFKMFFEIEHELETSKNLSIILFIEKDIARSEYRILINKCSLLFDHLHYYPLYNENDSRSFIRYYNKQWHFKLPKILEDEIINNCGGYLWLISQAHKYLRDNPGGTPNDAFSSNLMREKILTVWSKFTPVEQSILEKTVTDSLSFNDKQTPEFRYLKEIRFIKENSDKTELLVPLIKQAIYHQKSVSILKAEGTRILNENNDISHFFSPKEIKVLIKLISEKNNIVTRNEIAKSIWKNNWEDKYSDWAIDMLMSRLRKKLIQLKIDPRNIKTIKRKGFIYG